MISARIVEAIDKKLKASTALVALVPKASIGYGRGPITATWPNIHFFEVASGEGYQVDFNSCTVQISIWATNPKSALSIKEVVYGILSRFRGKIAIAGGSVDITWTELVDSGALPETDPQLYGQYLRFLFRYRGENLGGY